MPDHENDPAPPAAGVAETLRARLGECSPAERKVARALLADYPGSALGSAASVAAAAGASAPTALRLVARLGFGSFPDFQRAVRAELGARSASPLSLLEEHAAAGGDGETLHQRAGPVLAGTVARTLEAVPAADLDQAVGLLADPRRRVLICGGRFSHLLGQYLLLHLTQMRPGVESLGFAPVERAARMVGAGRDVVVVFDFRRYEAAAMAVAEQARARRAPVVLFTDHWLSPVAGLADVVLPARVDAPSAYDSLVGTMALVEVVVAGVLNTLGPAAQRRMAECEGAATALGLLDEPGGAAPRFG